MHTHVAIRNCGDVPAGEPLTIHDPNRAALMERMHMVRPLVEPTEEAHTPNLDAPIKQLPQVLRGIEDVATLEAALAAESRTSARRLFKSRLRELESNDE